MLTHERPGRLTLMIPNQNAYCILSPSVSPFRVFYRVSAHPATVSKLLRLLAGISTESPVPGYLLRARSVLVIHQQTSAFASWLGLGLGLGSGYH